MLTPLWNVCGKLNFDTFVLSKNIDQRTSYGTEDKHSLLQQIRVYKVIVLFVRKTGHIYLVLVGLIIGWQMKYRWILKSLKYSTG